MKKIRMNIISIVAIFTMVFLLGSASVSAATITNVALNKDVVLNGGPFFTNGWGGGLVVNESTIVDGVFLPRGTQWDQGPVWWDCHNSPDCWITIDLGDFYMIESVIVQADDNDGYLLYYMDLNGNWQSAWNVPNYDDMGWGMQTRPNPADVTERYMLPGKIVADNLLFKGVMNNGDLYFSVSEIQVYGCLDRNANMICDEDEVPAPEPILAIVAITAIAPALAYGSIRRRKKQLK